MKEGDKLVARKRAIQTGGIIRGQVRSKKRFKKWRSAYYRWISEMCYDGQAVITGK
ncbi:MAG: hypothetical protein WDO19_14930 [Bacteroidota bacterium]